MATFIGQEVASSQNLTQVYTATHRGDGDRLPYMNRSFISFSFGEKNGKRVNIEDFNLIATIDGDRWQREGSSQFENITTSYEVVNGQLYWGTYFQGNTLSLNLATDGMTQRQLDDFLMWFRGGETRELILSEHPNRAIFARVAAPPSLSLLPFEKKETVKISINTFTTSTTLYRGEIGLEFQMDEPFWYAKENIFGHFDPEKQIYVDEWIDANGRAINVSDVARNKDVIKIVLEDGIPLSTMIQDNMLLGNNIVANTHLEGGAIIADDTFRINFHKLTEEEIASIIDQETEDETDYEDSFSATYYCVEAEPGANDEPYKFRDYVETLIFYKKLTNFPEVNGNTVRVNWRKELGKIINYNYPSVDQVKEAILPQLSTDFYTDIWEDTNVLAQIAENDDDMGHARITGVYMTDTDGITDLPANNGLEVSNYFYYAGTAPAYPTLEFILTPQIDANGYIITPANTFGSYQVSDRTYNTFTIESQNKYEFKFTTPNIYTSYNTAIKLFIDNNTKTNNEVYEIMQENIKHYAVRAWAIRILDSMPTIDSTLACTRMTYFFKDFDADGSVLITTPSSAKFSFDSKTGLAYGTFKYRDCSTANSLPNSDAWASYCTGQNFVENTENVGDMIKSDWLVIKERNYPDEDHLIRGWSAMTEEGKSYSYKIYHDVPNGLQNVKLIYNNMYV